MIISELIQNKAGKVENIDLRDLILHDACVQSEARLDHVYEIFKQNGYDYMAVMKQSQLVGLCSKIEIGFLLGSRFGFAVMGKKKVEEHMVHPPFSLIRGEGVREALVKVLSRDLKHFYDDVTLISEDGSYLGVIPVPYLVHLQTALMQEKYREMEYHGHQMQESLHHLESSRKRNELLFENQALGILFLDADGRIRELNQKMVELLGFSAATEILSREFFGWIVEQEQGRFNRYLHEMLENPGTEFEQSQEFEFYLEDKSVRYFRVLFGRIPDYREPCLFVSDVTEQHAIEKALMSKEKAAVVESLVCGIAHELNNKLSPIMGLSELLLLDCDKYSNRNFQLRDHLQTIHDTSKEAAVMIRQLQQLSHPTKPSFKACDARTLLDGALSMLRHLFTKEGIFLKLEVPSEGVQVRADASQLKQVFINLVLNAVHAMRKKDEKTLELQVLLDQENVQFVVSDTGEGIPESILSKIFDPFFTTKPSHEGTGLGLAVCQSIIQHHEGTLGVTSERGVGTRFMVTLPRLLEEVSQEVLDASVVPALKADDLDFLQGSRILIVDDEHDICHMLQSAFSSLSTTTIMMAYSQEKAVDLLKMYRFDWVISDLRMPFYNGIDLYDWIAMNQPGLKKKFLLMTGESDHSELSKIVQEMGLPVLRKPFSILKLTKVLQSLLDKDQEFNLVA